MEHLHGADLAATLARRGPLPVALAVEAVVQACEALAEAHALGIVHRDLKPANLFLTESVDGSPCIKVLDFGISRMVDRSPRSQLTDPGTVLGTPSYMAPEQMEGNEHVDARSDIWALGTILFELLVGRPPWSGQSLPQIFVKIMRSKTPRPSLHRAGVPAALDAVVARCLAIDPEDRWSTVAELACALAELGPPRLRDSAARATRVWERRSDPGMSGIVTVRPGSRRGALRPATHLAAALAAGMAIGLGTIALHRAPVGPTPAPAAFLPVEEDDAVVIAPVTRPAAPAIEPAPVPILAPPRASASKQFLRREPAPSLEGASLATAPTDER
jgi:serine/threonine-protein kinase